DNYPLANVRLRDGALLSIVLPPVSSRGPCLTLRKPSSRGEDLRALELRGALSGAMVEFLGACLTARISVLVCGAASSGKQAVLGALASDAPANERMVSVEEVSSLKIGRSHWIALETRPGDGDGTAHIGIEELLRGALRMHPDRLVVGDIRGTEAFELVQAMLASFDGTLASITGEGALAALGRLALLTGLSCAADSSARREMVSCAVDVVVHVVRYGDGVVRIASIDEVTGSGTDAFTTQNLFRYDESGTFSASGVVPTFYAELGARGLTADASVFQ
ncbi:MAG: CpaF family protein, partial [Myxococcales bacterium]|nr:CpaF family protein [Myxococcales bacterium]